MRLDITEIRSILNKKELERFGKFIRSPFFNSEPRFIKLFDFITTGTKKITRENIAEEMFGAGILSSDVRFRKLVSEFMKFFERFLSELEYDKDIYRQKLGTAQQLHNRGNSDPALSVLKQPIEELEKMPMKDENLLNRLLELYSLNYNINGEDFRAWENDLSIRINNILDEYFVTFKSFLLSRFISLEAVFNIEEKIAKSFEHCLTEYAGGENHLLSHTNSDAYLRFLIYKMFDNPDSSEYIVNFLSTLEKAEEAAPGKCKVLFGDLMNQYTRLINLGKPGYEMKILELTQIMEEKGYYANGITFIEIATIVEASIGAGEFDWAIEFLMRMRDKITENHGESIFSAYSAKLYFFKKEYKNARKHINLVEPDDYLLYSESRLLECRILFDEDLIMEILLAIDKIGKYLKSHKEIGSHYRKTYSLFLDALKTLTRIREKKQQGIQVSFELSKLKNVLMKERAPIYAQEWLIDKIVEIEKAD